MQESKKETQHFRLRALPEVLGHTDYHYNRLPTRTSIRLLRFNGSHSQPSLLNFSLRTVDLAHDQPYYSALSYVWYDGRPTLTQSPNETKGHRSFCVICNGCRVGVSYNLLCALRRLTSGPDGILSDGRNLSIWIDQLCINQENPLECQQQLSIVNEIFTGAKEVVSWLGEEDSSTRIAISLLEKLASILPEQYCDSAFDVAQTVHEFPRDQWFALGSLLSRPYFKRAWVLLEITLARRVSVICGSSMMSWDIFVHCADFIQKTRAWALLPRYANLRPIEDHICAQELEASIRFGQNISTLIMIGNTITSAHISPEDILLLGKQFDATKVHDKFYAMYGLARYRAINGANGEFQLPSREYERPIEDVAVAISSQHLRVSNGLTLLSMVEDHVYRTNDKLPSWVPDPAAPLMPIPLWPEVTRGGMACSWMASGSQTVSQTPLINGGQLTVRGLQIDIVARTTISFNDLLAMNDWSTLLSIIEPSKNVQVSGATVDMAFWKTLITTNDRPFDSHSVLADLKHEFGDWIISVLYNLRVPREKSLGNMVMTGATSPYYSQLDTLGLDVLAYDSKVAFNLNTSPLDGHEEPGSYKESGFCQWPEEQSTATFLNTPKTRESEDNETERNRDLAAQLEQTILRLWQTNPDGAFPNPARVRKTMHILEHYEENSPRRSQLQGSIGKFKRAMGTKLHSRRILRTAQNRLGIGPQSLQVNDEVWVLAGATVPFILRRLESARFQVVGEAFVYGVMHGEAVQNPTTLFKSITIE